MKKKALIFIEDGSYSYDNRVKREAATLVEEGWDVTIVSPKYPSDPFYCRMGGRLRCYHYPKPTAKSPAGHLIEHSISLVAGSILTFWIALRHGFSVFHACNPMDILWMIALPYKALGKRFIFDHHDLCPELYLSRERGNEGSLLFKTLCFLERFSFKCANVVISTNESYKEVAISRGGKKPERVFVVRNGPDLQKFKPVAPEFGLKAEGEKLIGYLGNMNPQDGVDYLLSAMKHILGEKHRQDIRMVLVGDGSSQAALAALAVEMGLSEHVRFTGRIPDEEMLHVISACDLCVQPDPQNPLNDKSTMNKVMEYMALGKPVVAFDLCETRVTCGDAALYVSGDRPVDLAEGLLSLADNPRLRAEMVALGQDRVRKVLAWEYSIPNLLAAYECAMQST